MLVFIIQFFCGLLIGIILDLSLHYEMYNQLDNMNEKLEITVQAVKSKMIEVKSKNRRSLNDIIRSTLTICENILNPYSIRNLSWNLISHLTSGHSNLRLAQGKRRCCLHIKELLPKKDHPRTVKVVNEWVDKEKGKGNEDDNSINYNV